MMESQANNFTNITNNFMQNFPFNQNSNPPPQGGNESDDVVPQNFPSHLSKIFSQNLLGLKTALRFDQLKIPPCTVDPN